MSPRKAAGPWQDRLRARISEPDENGCRIWTGTVKPDGYGTFFGIWGIERSGNSGAHRWAYIDAHGSIPAGMHLDHLCNVRACVNVEHLEPVTPSENMRRAWARRKAQAEGRAA